jgi:myo-inositol-1(or 4)-monophosphatase
VANRKTLADSLISTGIPHRGRTGHERFLTECKALMAATSGLRRTGSAAIDLAWVAAGRFDGFLERELKPWDMAGGMILVREAGGYVSDVAGAQKMFEAGSIVAGNQAIHRALLQTLKSASADAGPKNSVSA